MLIRLILQLCTLRLKRNAIATEIISKLLGQYGSPTATHEANAPMPMPPPSRIEDFRGAVTENSEKAEHNKAAIGAEK